jgi:hypothetical protein
MTSWEGSGGNEAMVPAYQLETRVAKLISREGLLLSLIAGLYPIEVLILGRGDIEFKLARYHRSPESQLGGERRVEE